MQISCLPPEASALYRQRVDPLATRWYEEGIAQRNTNRLAEVVDKMFCCSSGDKALWALGEIELERGNCGAARRYWEQLIEMCPARVPAAAFEAAPAGRFTGRTGRVVGSMVRRGSVGIDEGV